MADHVQPARGWARDSVGVRCSPVNKAPTEKANDASVYSAHKTKSLMLDTTTNSREKLENVVNAPSTPVARNRRMLVEAFQTSAMASTSTPIANEPAMLTIRVA